MAGLCGPHGGCLGPPIYPACPRVKNDATGRRDRPAFDLRREWGHHTKTPPLIRSGALLVLGDRRLSVFGRTRRGKPEKGSASQPRTKMLIALHGHSDNTKAALSGL